MARPTARSAISGTAPVLELGLGYAAAPTVRLEVLVEYRPAPRLRRARQFPGPPHAGNRSSRNCRPCPPFWRPMSTMPGLGLARLGPLAPFVGAGVGAARTWIGETRMTFPATTTIVPGASRTGVAWMLTAGVAVALDERMTLDLAWRYSDLGEVRTGRGAGRVVWRDGSRRPLSLDLAATRTRLASHGLRLSLRYAF